MMKNKFFQVCLVGLLAIGTSGCLAIVGGAAAVTTVIVASDRRTVGTVIDDNLIELKINNGIAKDKELRQNAHINVTSMNGVVLLTGEAPTHSMRDRILTIARNTQEVRQVVNEIRIAAKTSLGSRSNDSWLTTKVKTKLLKTRGITDASRINVHVAYSVVYLMGLVSHQEAEAATNAARTTGGVTRVVKVFEYID
jgi:osmotically-inducible protein OsmY